MSVTTIPYQLRMSGDMVTKKMFNDTIANGGTTVDLETFKVPAKTDGFFVGAAVGHTGAPIRSRIISADAFSLKTLRQAFGHLYAEHLTREEIESSKPLKGAYIGTWKDDSGNVHVDAVNWTSDRAEAVRWGVERGELAIYDVAANGSLELSGTVEEMLAAA